MDDGQKKTILIVEDDPDLRAILRDHLFQKYAVHEARDGEEALALCVDRRPDLVLLDLLLPKLDGFKVLERIRNYPDQEIAKTHVVVLSNLWSHKDIIQVQGLKIDEYFVKSDTKLEAVYARIDSVLAGRVK